jgi:hypothetical protein
MNNKSDSLLPIESIQSKIFVIRGKKVLIDRHLAKILRFQFGTLGLNKTIQ